MCDCWHIYVDVWISLLLLLYASKGSMIMVIKYALPEKWIGKNNWITMKNHVYDDDEKMSIWLLQLLRQAQEHSK